MCLRHGAVGLQAFGIQKMKETCGDISYQRENNFFRAGKKDKSIDTIFFIFSNTFSSMVQTVSSLFPSLKMPNVTAFDISMPQLSLLFMNNMHVKLIQLSMTHWIIQNNLQLQVACHKVLQKENMHIHWHPVEPERFRF